jgi:uncharacterized protein YndB with AHSA1/START domain
MPSFDLTAHTTAPLEDVWKLLHDPTRFPEWWAGIGTVEPASAAGATYTMYPEGYPDFPMAQRLETTSNAVTISCLVSDLVFRWQLSEADPGTDIAVEVELPEREAHRLPDQRRLVAASISALAELATRA